MKEAIIDPSAFSVARHLGTDGINREREQPVIAVIPHETSTGLLAVTHEEGAQELSFITGRTEAPVLNPDLDPADQIRALLHPFIEELNINPRVITGVAGLAVHDSVGYHTPIRGDTAPDGRRTIRVLPFLIDLSQRTRLPRAGWYSLSHIIHQGWGYHYPEPPIAIRQGWGHRTTPKSPTTYFIAERLRPLVKPGEIYNEGFSESDKSKESL